MSNNNNNSSNGGVGFVGLLTIVFITLKLVHVIDWSWWWVLSPLWITTGVVVLVVAVIGLGYGTYKLIQWSQNR